MNWTKARTGLTLLALLLLTACSDDGRPWWCAGADGKAPLADLNVIGCGKPFIKPEALPYDAWGLRFTHPSYMEVWVDGAQVMDIDNEWARNAGGGVVSSGDMGGARAEGWTNHNGVIPGGKGRRIPGVNLPKEIFVRWKSHIESKTYSAAIAFPEWAREEMVKPIKADCPFGGKQTEYRKDVLLGLAPGGKVKVWVSGPCLEAIEVTNLKADLVPEVEVVGPYTPSPEAQEYVEKYGIPYDTW